MSTAIVIPYLKTKEPLLQQTAASAKASCPDAQIILVEDTAPYEGPAYSRHRGIELAKQAGHDTVILADAHCLFKDDALTKMAREAELFPMKLNCCCCHHTEDLTFTDKPMKGGVLTYKDNRSRLVSDHHPIMANWKKDDERMTCILGGCYSMSLKLYEHLGSPNKLSLAWGCEEELLSISAFFHGVQLDCLPVDVAHLDRRKTGIKYDDSYVSRVWANKLNFLRCLPMPQEELAELSRWMMLSRHCRLNAADVLDAAEHRLLDSWQMRKQLTEAGAANGRTWEMLKQQMRGVQ